MISLDPLLSIKSSKYHQFTYLFMRKTSRRLISSNPESQISTQFQTNRPFHHIDSCHRTITHYLPCHVRFLLKEIQSICAVDLEAEILGNLIISFTFEETDQKLIKKITSKKEDAPAIMLEFNKEDSILLKEGNGISMRRQDNFIEFVIRKKFNVSLRGHVFLTPFEKLNMYLSVTIQPVLVEDGQGSQRISHKFKFNCMNHTGADQQKEEDKDKGKFHIVRHLSSITFGHYRVVSSHMEAAFTMKRDYPFDHRDDFCRICENHDDYQEEEKNPEDEETKSLFQREEQGIVSFHYAHFRIPIYKYPGTSILTIFVPIQILGAIGLLVFFQEPSLSSRLATIATLILAFVAFIPTINASIPQSPTIKLVQILIFLHLIAIILLGTQSFLSKDQNGGDFDWSNNLLFLVAAVLNMVTFMTVVFLFAIHKCVLEPKLKRTVPGILKRNPQIKPEDWTNNDCDEHFMNYSAKNSHSFIQTIEKKKGGKN